MPTHIESLTTDQFFDQIILKEAIALIKVSSEWSSANQILSTSLQSILPNYSDQISFFSVDMEAGYLIMNYLNMPKESSLLLFKNGTLVDRLSGLPSSKVISERINLLINS